MASSRTVPKAVLRWIRANPEVFAKPDHEFLPGVLRGLGPVEAGSGIVVHCDAILSYSASTTVLAVVGWKVESLVAWIVPSGVCVRLWEWEDQVAGLRREESHDLTYRRYNREGPTTGCIECYCSL